MKRTNFIPLITLLFAGTFTFKAQAQITPTPMSMPAVSYPWDKSALLEPSVLAGQIKAGSGDIPVIFNIGAVEDIKGAKHIGPVKNAENMETFKKALVGLPKSTALVIYCGCCPFTKCPNIRPAFIELKKSGFTNIKVLDLSTNLKTNWIAHGYPLAVE